MSLYALNVRRKPPKPNNKVRKAKVMVLLLLAIKETKKQLLNNNKSNNTNCHNRIVIILELPVEVMLRITPLSHYRINILLIQLFHNNYNNKIQRKGHSSIKELNNNHNLR